jgi:hypothetical protein
MDTNHTKESPETQFEEFAFRLVPIRVIREIRGQSSVPRLVPSAVDRNRRGWMIEDQG